VKLVAVLCLLASVSSQALAQDEGDLTAKKRIYAGVGPGLRAVKHGADGKTYILASPTVGLAVLDPQGKQLLSIGAVPAGSTRPANSPLVFGEDCDIDADGKIYVADRGANRIQIFATDGGLLRSIPVPGPISVAALPEGEVAVATLRQPSLVVVFDKNGRNVREFGDPEPLAERAELNRYLSAGELATDAQGHLYYGFFYLPEPTVRQYDSHGYAKQEIQYTAIEAMPAAQAARKEIERQERRGDAPSLKRLLTAIGIDRNNGDVWMALHNRLLHFDNEGTRRATYLIYTPENARLDADVLLIEKDRLLVGSDPLGIYEFERPDKKISK
jgi:hypothetical protein